MTLHLTPSPVEDALHSLAGTAGFAMLRPARAGLPDAVVALLSEMHDRAVRMAAFYHSDIAKHGSRFLATVYRENRDKDLATAQRIRNALCDAGHGAEAAALDAALGELRSAMRQDAWPHPMTEAA